MSVIALRRAERSDIPALSAIRARDWGTIDFWAQRLENYFDGLYNPLDALDERIVFAAQRRADLIGFAAGHLSRRYDCDGELQWIAVLPEFRGLGIASQLFHQIAGWFAEQNAQRICINCDVEDEHVLRFLTRHGAVPISRHWMMWPDIRMHAMA